MKKADERSVTVNTGTCFVLFVVFLVLRLTGVIAWSWWLVTMPLWLPYCLIIACIFLAALFSDDD